MIKAFNFTIPKVDKTILLISPFIIVNAPTNIYRLSKDAEDIYLYDLCIQNNCSHLITVDKVNLTENNAPFIRKTDAWLKKKKQSDIVIL